MGVCIHAYIDLSPDVLHEQDDARSIVPEHEHVGRASFGRSSKAVRGYCLGMIDARVTSRHMQRHAYLSTVIFLLHAKRLR